MKKNMGRTDRIVRILLALTIVILYFTHQISGSAAIILGILGIIFLATSYISFCPLYFPFGISTRKKTEK
ncbi:MAG: DUF2892 domain-containing protein [Chitinophagaceae bacterium]